MSELIRQRDPLYMFACHLEWHIQRDLVAYAELLAALDDPDPDIRLLAESLMHRKSPRPISRAEACKLNSDSACVGKRFPGHH